MINRQVRNSKKCCPVKTTVEKKQLKSILLSSAICLILGHLSISYYFSNFIFWVIGIFAISYFLYNKYILKGDNFSLVLVMFILSHFDYADNQGGLFNIIFFVLFLLYFFQPGGPHFKLTIQNTILRFCVLIIVIANYSGLLFNNEADFFPKFVSGVSFISFFLMLIFVLNTEFKLVHLRLFIKVCAILAVYNFIVGINQRYGTIFLNTPVFPLVSQEAGYTSTMAAGTLNNYALFGEYSLLTFIFSFPILINSELRTAININRTWVIILTIAAFLNLIGSNSRSVTIISISYVLIYATFQLFNFKMTNFLKVVSIVFVFLTFVLTSSEFIGLESLKERLSLIDVNALSVSKVIDGEEINRGILFAHGIQRLSDESWWLGHGYGTPAMNSDTWFGKRGLVLPGGKTYVTSDIHSLYLGLPMLFGWVGGVAFLMIFLLVIGEALGVGLSKIKHPMLPIYFSILFFFLFLLINEYKINLLIMRNYPMVLMIWIGVSLSILKFIRTNNLNPAK